jgi:hypothetical protein
MKRIIATALVALVIVASAFAAEIDLGQFPKGRWLNPNWDAVWEFGADGIRILDRDGSVVYDFEGKISGLKVDVGVGEVTLSFACADAERSYVFTKKTTDLGLSMKINPEWTEKDYAVDMELQR